MHSLLGAVNCTQCPRVAGNTGDKIMFVHTVKSQGCERRLLRQFSWYLAVFAWGQIVMPSCSGVKTVKG